MLKIALNGANGRMGLEIAGQIRQNSDKYSLEYALVSNINNVDNSIKQLARYVTDKLDDLNNVDIVIDFSAATATLKILS